MSATDTAGGYDPATSAAGGHNPWLIAVVVSIATFMEVLDTTIANVSLRHIAGSLAASIDQSTWIITSYLVANAVSLSISGWLATALGRKRFYMLCVALFAASSLLCGLAWNLTSLIVFRVLQGLGGGGMAPSEQAILADSFPPEKRGQAFSVYGVAVVVAPVIGPTLGGWITDTYSWHWVFLINVPMGILSLVLVGMLVHEPSSTQAERKALLGSGAGFDWIGFLLVATGLGCLEVVLDEGQREDWFQSGFIVTFALISGLSLAALIPWELTRRSPVLDVSLLFRRQFGTCFLVMTAVGAILISTVQILPQLLQENFGYTATLAGLTVSPGGLMTMMMMPLAGRATNWVQPKYLIAGGGLTIAGAMVYLTGMSPGLTFSQAAWARIILAAGLPFIFVSITTASFDGLPRGSTNQASALINVARNLGGSFGVALVQTMLARESQVHQTYLAAHAVPSDPRYQATLKGVTDYFLRHGSSQPEAAQQAFAWIGRTVGTQASLLAYIDVFWALALLALVVVPLAFLVRPAKPGGAPPA